MANKKSGMVNALIIANAILALVIGAIVWLLVSKRDGELTNNNMALLSESATSQPTNDGQIAANQAAIEKLRQTLALERQQAEQQQRAEQQKIQQLMQALEQEKQRTQAEAKTAQTLLKKQLEEEKQKTALAEKIAAEKEALANQLKLEQARVDEMASAQVKTNLENRRLIEQLRAQIQNSQRFALATSDSSILATDTPAPQFAASVDSAVAQASQSDKDYIQALAGDVQPFIQTETQKRALAQVGTEKVDYFNRVVVASNSDNPNTGAITSKVDQLLAERENKDATSKATKMVDKNYLTSLDPLAQQREAESRFITVEKGDTLSNIAARAYGDGQQYRRIFEANPQIIVNPHLIYPGQVLRVPL